MAVRIPCDLQRLSSAVRQDTVGDRRRNRPVSAPTHRPPYRPPSPKKHYHPPPSRHHPLPAASPLTPAPPRSHTPHRTPPRTAQDTSTSAINPSSPCPSPTTVRLSPPHRDILPQSKGGFDGELRIGRWCRWGGWWTCRGTGGGGCGGRWTGRGSCGSCRR